MPNPARSSGFFTGLVLISVGTLILLHNYGHLELMDFFGRWWPLLIIFWGAVKLYERTAGRRFGSGTDGRITGSEVLLVLGMFVLLGIVVMVDYGREKLGPVIKSGDDYSYDVAEIPPMEVPGDAHILVHNGRGDISVRASDEKEVRVTAKASVNSWSQSAADHLGKSAAVEIVKNGDGYEVRPKGFDLSDSRISVDLDVAIPNKSPLVVKTEKGDVTVAGIGSSVAITDGTGDVDVRDTGGDVNVEMVKGDVKVAETKGDVKISGKGGEIEVNDTSGSITVDGSFYGPVRADKAAKGVRIVAPKTDLTVSSLMGHLEAASGNMDIVDAPGNLDLRTRNTQVNVENPGGKVNIDNRNGNVTVRYSSTPKEDLTVMNSSSEISVTLPGSASFEVTGDCQNCEIDSEFPMLNITKSEAGNSHVSGKYGNGKGPKISLKTSYGNISLRRTTVEMMPHVPAPPAPPRPLPPAGEQ